MTQGSFCEAVAVRVKFPDAGSPLHVGLVGRLNARHRGLADHGIERRDAVEPADFLGNADGHALVKAFMKIKDAGLRRAIVRMVEAIVAKD